MAFDPKDMLNYQVTEVDTQEVVKKLLETLRQELSMKDGEGVVMKADDLLEILCGFSSSMKKSIMQSVSPEDEAQLTMKLALAFMVILDQ